MPDRLGLRAQDLFRSVPPEREPASQEEARQRERWLERRTEAVRRGRVPSMTPFTATEAEALPPGAPLTVELITVERDPDRPSGPRFGTLVHNILRDVDLVHRVVEIETLAVIRGRILGASAAEVLAATHAVERALEHPILVAARQAAYLARELPVRLRNPDGSLLEGEIDLVFGDPNHSLVVVDFKTDRDPSLSRDKYERQIAWYAAALQAERAREIRAVILVL